MSTDYFSKSINNSFKASVLFHGLINGDLALSHLICGDPQLYGEGILDPEHLRGYDALLRHLTEGSVDRIE